MVRKPGGRRRRSRRIQYAAIGVALVAVVGVIAYVYLTPKPTNCSQIPNPARVYVRFDTTQGCIEMELFPASAPKTVANFLNLIGSGYYDGLVWHRISTNPYVIQTGDNNSRNGGGDRRTWGSGGSALTVPLEISNTTLHDDRGYVGMARGSNLSSGSSQFFINYQDNRGIDPPYTQGYTIFGRVIAGMSTVDAISKLQISTTYSEQPADPLNAMITNATVVNAP